MSPSPNPSWPRSAIPLRLNGVLFYRNIPVMVPLNMRGD
jgi:hypothetical protein